MTGVGEGALGEREDLGRLDFEHEGHPAILVVKAAVSSFVLPSSVPFRGPCRGQALEQVVVSDPDGVALDHDIESCVPDVAASHQNHVWIPLKVLGLLFGGARGEVESPIEPHGNQRSHVGATVGPDRRDPEKFSLLQRSTCLIPSGGNRGRVAEARVNVRHWFVHHKRIPFHHWVMVSALIAFTLTPQNASEGAKKVRRSLAMRSTFA